jgi:hypothetical protein
LKSGRIDVAILDSVFGLESFGHRELLRTDMVAIAPPQSTETTIADLLANHAVCMPSVRTGLGHEAMAFSQASGRRRFRHRDITAADSLPVIVDLVACHGYVSFLGRVSAAPIAGKVRIVELGETVPMSYHVAFNHRRTAAEACQMIVEIAAEITAGPVARDAVFA